VGPADKVSHGLWLARQGFAELREERAALAQALDANRRAIAGGEQEALALRYEAVRDRGERSLGGTMPPRMRLRDGVGVVLPETAREEETARSLALYCPRGARAALPAARAERRGWWARWWGSEGAGG